jgi:hypothetical protein
MTMYNESVLAAAEKVARDAQRDFFNIRDEGAVTLSAIAGAGKSYFVMNTTQQCRRRGMRVAVAAPTNEQVFSLVKSIAENEPGQPVGFIPAKDVELPRWARLPNVQTFAPAHSATGQAVVIGTIDKLVVQLKQMIPALPFSSPPRKRGSRAASLVPAGLEPALLRP